MRPSVAPKLVPVAVLLALALSGCATDGGEAGTDSGGEPTAQPPQVEATQTTGGIRGVIVDEAIRPISGATIIIQPVNKTLESDADGLFAVSGLEPGEYFVTASHVLYSEVQASATVVAGDSNPKPLKLTLVRTVLTDPFMQTMQYDGFIICSINLVVLLSEECGEGVGVPCEVPVVGCQRVGGREGNNVQFDFTIGAGAMTLIVEKFWEPTSEAGKALYSPIATGWSCLPSCSGNGIASIDGESPLYVAVDNATLEKEEVVPDETVISIFTWASPSYTGVVLNQKYTDFVSVFYYVPAPEGWSFINGDTDPFR